MLRKALCLTAVLVLMVSGSVIAQEIKNIEQVPQFPNFTLGDGDACSSPNVAIPDNTPDNGVTDTLVIECPSGPIGALEVLVQVSHTWVGDLEVMLTKQGGASAVILDRPGLAPPLPPPGSCCGCSGNDIDAVFNDGGDLAAEGQCDNSPAIHGSVIAGDPSDSRLLAAAFTGDDLCGTWELRVTDGAGADTGSLNMWCLSDAGDNGPPPGVPAAGTTAIIVLIGLIMLGSTYYMIRRRRQTV